MITNTKSPKSQVIIDPCHGHVLDDFAPIIVHQSLAKMESSELLALGALHGTRRGGRAGGEVSECGRRWFLHSLPVEFEVATISNTFSISNPAANIVF
jgi:hypothetical protein